MSRYRYAVDQERAMVRTLWIVIGGLMMLTLVLGFGLLTAPDRLVVHIPPDLRSGAQFDAGTVGPEKRLFIFLLHLPAIESLVRRWSQ